MDDKNQREKLEQELRFLKESFEAEVISREEYQKGTERIEQKLRELQNSPKIENDKDFFEQKEKIIESDSGAKPAEKASQQPNESNGKNEKKSRDGAETGAKSEHTGIDGSTKEKKENKLFRYVVVFVVLALIIFFSYSLLNNTKTAKNGPGNAPEKFTAACSSDEDCRETGKQGICLNAGKREARCEFRQIQKTNILVLNGRKECFNCGTERVIGILENWLGPLNPREIDYGTEEGRKFSELINARLLPAYILEENITQNPGFDKYKQAFVKKDGYYALSENAAGSAFYFKRENIPNKLDLFAISGDSASTKAENNLKEFLEEFKGINFEKHFSEDAMAKELGIRTFPTFLVNNRVKFTGIQTAETIKENYCSLNKVQECRKNLSRNLV